VASQLAVPLIARQHVIGVIGIDRSAQAGPSSSEDQKLLEALAAQVAVAIESARLFDRVREERATLEAIINGTDNAIIVSDTADYILLFNLAARSAFLNGERLERSSLFSEAVHNQALLDFWSDASQKEARSTEIHLPDERTFSARMTFITGVGKSRRHAGHHPPQRAGQSQV